MNSKEALERIIKSHHIAMAMLCEGRKDDETEKAIETIKKDLDKLEELKVNVNVVQSLAKKYKQENDKLKLALDKAIEKCMKFDKCPPITCIELYTGNDNVCKECWKKYFMKEVLGND